MDCTQAYVYTGIGQEVMDSLREAYKYSQCKGFLDSLLCFSHRLA